MQSHPPATSREPWRVRWILTAFHGEAESVHIHTEDRGFRTREPIPGVPSEWIYNSMGLGLIVDI